MSLPLPSFDRADFSISCTYIYGWINNTIKSLKSEDLKVSYNASTLGLILLLKKFKQDVK